VSTHLGRPIKTLAASGIKDFSRLLGLVARSSPLGRNITIDDVGNVAAFLLSDLAASPRDHVRRRGFSQAMSGTGIEPALEPAGRSCLGDAVDIVAPPAIGAAVVLHQAVHVGLEAGKAALNSRVKRRYSTIFLLKRSPGSAADARGYASAARS